MCEGAGMLPTQRPDITSFSFVDTWGEIPLRQNDLKLWLVLHLYIYCKCICKMISFKKRSDFDNLLNCDEFDEIPPKTSMMNCCQTFEFDQFMPVVSPF